MGALPLKLDDLLVRKVPTRSISKLMIAEPIAERFEAWDEQLDVAADAVHGLAGDGAGVGVDGLGADGGAEGEEVGPDALVLACEVAAEVGLVLGGHGGLHVG